MEKQKRSLKKLLGEFLFSYNSVVILLLLLVIGSFAVGKFTRNLSTMWVEAGVYGFVALGLGLVMITGNIDLSVGFQLGASSVVTIIVLNATGSLLVAVLAALLCGAVMGAINGFSVVKLGINPLIATIATCYIYKGFVYYFTKDGAIYPESGLKDILKETIAKNQLFDVKILTLTIVLFVIALAIVYFVMRKTRFGISLYISGDNADAGRLAGININRTNFLTYVICGVCCAIAGIFFASNAGGAVYTQGEGREVFAISACVIGGIKMAGGKGTAVNLLLGVLIMRIISTSMNLLIIPSSVMDMVSGALLIIVLIIDRVTSTKKED